MRRLILNNPQTIIQELKRINIDPAAFALFTNKAQCTIIKFENLSCAQANVLKQIALICGADVAIPKNAYTGSTRKKMPAMLFANLREIEKMQQRMEEQPWIRPLSKQLTCILNEQDGLHVLIGRKKVSFNRTYIMGVINVTPDSFYRGSSYMTHDAILQRAQTMAEDGADFIDIGAESSRPGARAVSVREELRRLKKILPLLIKRIKLPISIDTQKAEVARFAIDHGAQIVNDISGLAHDRRMVTTVAHHKIALILMHIQGTPKTMQIKPHYDDLMGELHQYFRNKIDHAVQKGVTLERIILDPGLGFGKRLEDNYEIINRLGELAVFKRPILVGHSRKSFVGKPFNIAPEQRLAGTLALEALLIQNGASIVRVHDVAEAKRAALVIDKIKA